VLYSKINEGRNAGHLCRSSCDAPWVEVPKCCSPRVLTLQYAVEQLDLQVKLRVCVLEAESAARPAGVMQVKLRVRVLEVERAARERAS